MIGLSHEPASLAIQAIAVAVRRFRDNWKPITDLDGTGSTAPGVFGAFTEDIAELSGEGRATVGGVARASWELRPFCRLGASERASLTTIHRTETIEPVN